ncbi:MAG: PadR family transcriptional regulator [Clostridiaceae bacterium]|nr:PadR family transcriptional regulator [Clostridiales bacterium]MDD4140497.1 PadR family transcriptional regulator [Eubacteriales bacterium]NLB44981.1 PadR family transcriptional regulator [Clostridiaceae bacterium]
MNIQFKKGVLELCVLSMLIRRDQYGYELASTLSETIQIADGTIYPILRKLASDGQVTTYLQESSEGPPRKYYTITPAGRQTHQALLAEWRHFIQHVHVITGGDL